MPLVGAAELSDVVPETSLYVARFVKTALEERSNPVLGGGSPQSRDERVPLGRDLCVGGQTVQVNQAFRLRDGLPVER